MDVFTFTKIIATAHKKARRIHRSNSAKYQFFFVRTDFNDGDVTLNILLLAVFISK